MIKKKEKPVKEKAVKEKKVKFKDAKKANIFAKIKSKKKKADEVEITENAGGVKKKKKFKKPAFIKKLNGLSKNKKINPEKVGKGSIRKKLNNTIFGIIILFVILLVVLGGKALQYSNQYAAVLDNITKITYIKANCPKVANTITNLANFNSSIEQSGHKEIIENVSAYLQEIRENIGDDPMYSQNRSLYDNFANEVNKYLTNFDTILTTCGDTYNKKAEKYALDMVDESAFIITKADALLTSEIDRSGTVQSQIEKEFRITIIVLAIVTVIAIIIALIVTLFVSNGIIRQVAGLQKNLMIMASGDLTGDDVAVTTEDEIGQATIAFNQMKNNLVQIIAKVKDNSSELQSAITTVNTSVEENSKGSEKVSQSVEEMFGNLERQQDEIQKFVQQSEEMNDISKQVAGNAELIHQNAQNAQNSARDGMDKMNAYVLQMEEVNRSMEEMEAVFATFDQSTREMESMLDSIVSIASQTNLLSLNASIEAARAGEAGRGFAVVATEIRKLADNSQASATQIGELIHTVQGDVDKMREKLQVSMENLKIGNRITEETKISFTGIQNVTEEVGDSVNQIIKRLDLLLGMITETTNGMNKINHSADSNVYEINDISAVVTQESANLAAVSSTINSVLDLTNELDEMVSSFVVPDDNRYEGQEYVEQPYEGEVFQSETF